MYRYLRLDLQVTFSLVEYLQRSIDTLSSNHCCSGKAMSITYYERVFVALGIQHAMRMIRIILSSVACPSPHYFFTLSHKGVF